MNDPYAPYLRTLKAESRAEERVAWLGRADTRAQGDVIPPGTVVLAHPRYPEQFRIDNPRHRAEFRRHGFTWTDRVAEELGVERMRRLPVASDGLDPRVLTTEAMTQAGRLVEKETADLDLNLRQAVGTRFPWCEGEAWWDGVLMSLPTVGEVDRAADLTEPFLKAWEESHRDPGMVGWPQSFRAEWLRLNRVLVYRVGSSRGCRVEVVVAAVTPLVLTFAPESAVMEGGDGLRVEWRPWDIRLKQLIREVHAAWQKQVGGERAEQIYYSLGLDVRHRMIPEELVPVSDSSQWECLWAIDPERGPVFKTPPRAGQRRFLRDFTERLVPETEEERICRVRAEIDRLRNERFGGSINIRLLRERTGYRRSPLRNLLLKLEAVDGKGDAGYAVRLPKSASRDQEDFIEVVQPESSEGRPVLAGWYRPRRWLRWVWMGVPAVASAALGYYGGHWAPEEGAGAWRVILVTLLVGFAGFVVRRFAEKRAKEVDET